MLEIRLLMIGTVEPWGEIRRMLEGKGLATFKLSEDGCCESRGKSITA